MRLRRVLARDRPPGTPLPPAVVREVLAAEAPQLTQVSDRPVAVGNLAQVHRGVWPDGREVAVKIQFPDAPDTLQASHERMRRGSRPLRLTFPGFPFAQLLEELHRGAVAELDYAAEAEHQRAFAAAYRGDPDILVAGVHFAGPRLLVTDWVAGTPIGDIVATGTQERRDRVAGLVTTFELSAPARVGLLHADPDGDNFRLLPDGRLAVLDFGAVAPYPDGLPPELAQLLRAATHRDPGQLHHVLRTMGALARPGRIAPQRLLSLTETAVLPVLEPGFRFDRRWLHRQVGALTVDGGLAILGGLRLPPGFLPLLRMVVGTVHLFCRLEARADYAKALATWLPGYAEA